MKSNLPLNSMYRLCYSFFQEERKLSMDAILELLLFETLCMLYIYMYVALVQKRENNGLIQAVTSQSSANQKRKIDRGNSGGRGIFWGEFEGLRDRDFRGLWKNTRLVIYLFITTWPEEVACAPRSHTLKRLACETDWGSRLACRKTHLASP